MTDKDSLNQYHAAAAAWEEDRLRDARASARAAWKVAAAAVVFGLGGLGTAIAIAPMKTVVPYLIRVDSSTGVVDVVPPVTGGVTPTEAVTRHLLHLYVAAKERYLAELAASDYAQVGSMQSAQLNQKLLHDWDRNNPDSPINRYRDGTSVMVRVHSITFLRRDPTAGNVAQVRFSTVVRPANGGSDRQSQWISTLAYRYGPVPSDIGDREANPLGLKVTEYQREPEATSAVEPGAGT